MKRKESTHIQRQIATATTTTVTETKKKKRETKQLHSLK